MNNGPPSRLRDCRGERGSDRGVRITSSRGSRGKIRDINSYTVITGLFGHDFPPEKAERAAVDLRKNGGTAGGVS